MFISGYMSPLAPPLFPLSAQQQQQQSCMRSYYTQWLFNTLIFMEVRFLIIFHRNTMLLN